MKEGLLLWLAETPKQRIAAMLGLDREDGPPLHRPGRRARTETVAGGQALTDERLEPILVALIAGTGRPRGEGWALCTAHHAFIEEKLKRERLRLTKVPRLLACQRVQIPYATLHRFAVAELKTFPRSTPSPSSQCPACSLRRQCWQPPLPARRALHADPLQVLRSDT